MANDPVRHPNARHGHARTDAGMTLVEMMVALLIITGSIASMLLIVVAGLKNQVLTERVDRSTAATQAVIAKARDADFGELGYYAADTAAPFGAVILPVSAVTTTGATGAALTETAVVLTGLRPVGTAVFTPAVVTSTLNGVDSKVTTTVTTVRNPDGTDSSSKRVTVVAEWGVHPNTLTAACGSAGVRCTTQSIVRTPTASDINPTNPTAPLDACVNGTQVICEAYIRSGRVLDGATMASANDAPEQVSDVDLYVRTASSASSVKATWTWLNPTGGTFKTVTETLAGSAEGTVWKYVVPADVAGAATLYKGDIRPGAVNVTFTAVMSATPVSVVTGAFWSYSMTGVDPSASNVTASIAQATTWCSVAGAGAPVQFAVTGHSYGFTDTTQNPSSTDTVAAIFTVTQAGATRTVTVPATFVAGTLVTHDQLINGVTVSGSPSATWSVVPPATERCDNRAVTLVVHRAADQTTTPLSLRLPFTVSDTLGTPSFTSTVDQATGAYTISWTTPAGATKFNIETTSGGVTTPTSGTTITSLTGTLALGDSLSVRAQATAGGLASPWSALTTVTRVTAAPVVSSATATSAGATFTWTAVTGASAYDGQYRINGGAWIATPSQVTMSLAVTAPSGATIDFQVRATDAGGASGYSTTVSLVVLPAAPTGLTVTRVTGRTVALSWSATGATSYTVNGGDSAIASGTTSATVPISALSANLTVTAHNAGGSSTSGALGVAMPPSGVSAAPYIFSKAPTTAVAGNLANTLQNPNGTALVSPGGRYVAVFQSDSNFVIYDMAANRAIAATDTSGAPNSTLVFQADGNLVLYSNGAALKWTSSAAVGGVLEMQDDGNLVLYDASMQPKWALSWGTGNYSFGANFMVAK